MALSDRVQIILSEQHLKQKEFAEAIKVTESYVSNLLRGKRNAISETLASLIEERYGYSSDWLLTGEGEVYKNASNDISFSPARRKVLAQIENMTDAEVTAVLAFINSLDEVQKSLN